MKQTLSLKKWISETNLPNFFCHQIPYKNMELIVANTLKLLFFTMNKTMVIREVFACIVVFIIYNVS